MTRRLGVLVLVSAATTVPQGVVLPAAVPADARHALQVEAVRFRNELIALAGTVVAPPAAMSRRPAAVIVHGAGREVRSKYRPAADFLAARGFVVLIYDKRGTGESAGEYAPVSVANSEGLLGELAGDAAAGVRLLAGRPDVDPRKIGHMGFSQAGWVVPLAARRSEGIAFMILFSSPAGSVGESILFGQLSGGSAGPPRTLTDEQIEERLRSFPGPFGFDPHRSLSSIDVPGLWLLGGKDLVVPVSRAAAVVRRLAAEERKPYTVVIYPEGDHELQDAVGGTYPFLKDAFGWLRERGLAPQD